MNGRSPLRRLLCLFLSAIAIYLGPGVAIATTIDHYITVQAIDVCSDASSGCAAINSLGDTVLTSPGTKQIGFIDPVTQVNSTQLIFNQAGIDVRFLPAAQYVNPLFTGLSVTNCTNNAVSCLTSIGFQSLSQQPGISGPPPTMPTPPAPPLAPSLTTMNMFFVSTLTPNVPGLLYGFSWINNNGVSIGLNTFSPPFGLPGRPDTIAHEIGHNLDLDHTTFGAGPVNGICGTACRNNLLTAGNLRTEPSIASLPNGQPAWVNQIFPSGALDQLNSTQIGQILQSGFVKPIAGISTDVTGTEAVPATASPVIALAPTSEFPGNGDFSVSFNGRGRAGESLTTLTLTAPDGVALIPSSFGLLEDPSGIIVTPQFSNCTVEEDQAACRTLQLLFSGAQFLFGDQIDYTVDVCSPKNSYSTSGRCLPISFSQLAGGTYKYQFSDGYETTSLLSGLEELSASAWNPDPNIPANIYDEALLVIADAGQLPCTPDPIIGCPNNPLDIGIADADPREEGGQPVPEPPTVLILLSALGLAVLLARASLRRSPDRCPRGALEVVH